MRNEKESAAEFARTREALNDLYEEVCGERPFEVGMYMADYNSRINEIALHWLLRLRKVVRDHEKE